MLLDILYLLCLYICSVLIGRGFVRALIFPPPNRVDRLALEIAVGFGMLALAIFGLGAIGGLSAWGIIAAVATLNSIALAISPRGGAARDRASLAAPVAESPIQPNTVFDVCIRLCLVVTLAATFVASFAPVTDGDALCYHLQVPKMFLQNQRLIYDADLHETAYPLLTEMHYAAALAFRGPVACRLVQWLLGVVFAMNVTALARPVLGTRAWWAGTLALLVPAISNGMSAPLNDVALAAFCNAALNAWLVWKREPAAGAAVLAGTLAGFALGVKYPALVWVGLLALASIAVWSLAKLGSRESTVQLRQIAIFAATAVLVGSCWYVRAYAYTGNPVHPFFRGVFGSGIDDVLDPIKRPLPVTVWNLATALVPMTLDPDRFDSFSHQFGPAFLLFLPALVLFRPPRRVWALVAFGFAFVTLCMTQRQSMRFLLPALGGWCVAVAWLAARWSFDQRRASKCLTAIVAAVLLFEAGLAAARIRHSIGVALGRESHAAYLAKREPTFVVGKWIATHLSANAKLIGQDHRGFYIPRPYTMELAHRRRTGLAARDEPADAIISTLVDRGFTHLLLCPPVPETAVEFDPLLTRRLDSWIARRDPIYRADLGDGDGVVRRYAIYALSDAGRVRR